MDYFEEASALGITLSNTNRKYLGLRGSDCHLFPTEIIYGLTQYFELRRTKPFSKFYPVFKLIMILRFTNISLMIIQQTPELKLSFF